MEIPEHRRIQHSNSCLNQADAVIIVDGVHTGEGPSNLPVVEVCGATDAIQQLDEAIMQLGNHSVLNEGDEMIAKQDNMLLLEGGCSEQALSNSII